MNRMCHLALLACLFGAPAAQAQYCGDGYGFGYGYGYGGLPAYALIQRPHPQENLFPQGGWTLYPGEAGSGVPSLSHYSHFYGVMPPAAYAEVVVAKLKLMGIPRKAPAPQFLGRNPNIDRNVDLPTPKSLLPRDEEKEKEKEIPETVDPPPLPRWKSKDAKGKEKEEDKNGDKDKDRNSNRRPIQLEPPAVEKNNNP